jgi:hypothetical protein
MDTAPIIISVKEQEFATKALKHKILTKGFGAIWSFGALVAKKNEE